MSARWLASVLVVAAAAACGGGSARAATVRRARSTAGPSVDAPPREPATHVPEPTPVQYSANPPASGPHWPMWQEPWQPYPGGLPRERWVHNLEHGGIVLAYNCPDGCDDVDRGADGAVAVDPARPVQRAALLVLPDSAMPHRVAAIAWGWRWQGEAVDMNAIRCFIAARYDRAPESIP